jgi:4-hydroxy-tetrahydrodipicolinate synthase
MAQRQSSGDLFRGVWTAMVTPFRNGAVDLEAVDRLVDHLLEGGIHGIVVAGSTGEGPVLEARERSLLVERVKRRAGDRVPVVASTGTNVTETTLALSRDAHAAGADGLMLVCPPYNKPTPRGLKEHFLRVAEEVPLPVMLYNVPGRTGVSLPVATALELAEHPRIQAIKEASGSLERASELAASGRLRVLSGDDALTLPMLAVGAVGVVSVIAHLFPRAMVRMLEAFARGDVSSARAIHHALGPAFGALFIETNPLPVKHALAQRGLLAEEFRLPLVPMGAENARRLEEILQGVEARLGEVL